MDNLNQLTNFLTKLIIIICIVIFAIGMIRGGTSWIDMLLTSISVAVAAPS